MTSNYSKMFYTNLNNVWKMLPSHKHSRNNRNSKQLILVTAMKSRFFRRDSGRYICLCLRGGRTWIRLLFVVPTWTARRMFFIQSSQRRRWGLDRYAYTSQHARLIECYESNRSVDVIQRMAGNTVMSTTSGTCCNWRGATPLVAIAAEWKMV